MGSQPHLLRRLTSPILYTLLITPYSYHSSCHPHSTFAGIAVPPWVALECEFGVLKSLQFSGPVSRPVWVTEVSDRRLSLASLAQQWQTHSHAHSARADIVANGQRAREGTNLGASAVERGGEGVGLAVGRHLQQRQSCHAEQLLLLAK